MAVLAPMPRASAATAAMVNEGFLANICSACLRSFQKSTMAGSNVHERMLPFHLTKCNPRLLRLGLCGEAIDLGLAVLRVFGNRHQALPIGRRAFDVALFLKDASHRAAFKRIAAVRRVVLDGPRDD